MSNGAAGHEMEQTARPQSALKDFGDAAVVTGILLIFLAPFLLASPFSGAIDSSHHLHFMENYFRTLSEGSGIPDWDASPFNGLGIPSFRVYGHLPYLVCSFFMVLGLSTPWALKATIFSFCFTGIWGLKRFLNVALPSRHSYFLLILFLLFPIINFHLLHLFFLHNFCAMLLFPWVLEGWFKEVTQGGGVTEIALFLGLIGFIHPQSALIAGFAVILATTIQTAYSGKTRAILPIVLSLVLGFFLSAPYTFPASMKSREVHFERYLATDPWNLNYFLDDISPAVSPKGESSPVWMAVRFESQVMLVGLLLLGISTFPLGRSSDPQSSPILAITCTGFVFLLLTLRPLSFLWKIIPGLPWLQYPWRLLFPAFFLFFPGFGSGFVSEHRGWRVLSQVLRILGVSCLLGLSLWIVFHIPGSLPMEQIRNNPDDYGRESLPRTCSNFHLTCPSGKTRWSYFISGEAKGTSLLKELQQNIWAVSVTSASATMVVETHWDLDWRVVIDDAPVPTHPFSGCGLIQFSVPAGNHRVHLFRDTPVSRYVGFLLMLLAAGIVKKIFLSVRPSSKPRGTPLEQQG